ncbi:MAG: DUF1844 domain-containing protein [Deltaproteobacteria bacterium]|nr:DUF1844 domain-containing protein [Deltaproteobacteria bacterium]
MGEQEEKGFVFKDRRKISLDESEREHRGESTDAPDSAGGRQEQAKQQFDEAAKSSAEKQGRVSLPEVSFSTFIFSLSSSALVHLGEIPEPDSKSVKLDLAMAKQIIDTLGMLQDKTKGNLEPEEEKLLKTVLYDLRLRFVQKAGG